jgi:hypothetical protein
MLSCKGFVTYFSWNTTTVALLVLFYTCKSAAQPTVHLKCKHCIRLHVFRTQPCNVYPTYCFLKWTPCDILPAHILSFEMNLTDKCDENRTAECQLFLCLFVCSSNTETIQMFGNNTNNSPLHALIKLRGK